MLTKQNFIGFLKDMNCLKEYKENIVDSHNQNIEDIWEKVIAGDWNRRNLIDGFFTWEYTKQGHDYWSAIDAAWKTLVEKDENLPVYEVTYSRREVCKVFCPKITKSQRMAIEDLIHNKYPGAEIWRRGDYLIVAEMIPSGLVESK